MCRACTNDPVLALSCPERIRDDLRSVYLFEDLGDSQMDEILAKGKSVHLDDGCWLYRQGDRAKRFFVVREGQMALFRQTDDGREAIIAIVGSGETFAAHLSIQPETLSRSLARLRDCQFLEKEGDSLVLVHTDELREGLKCSQCHIRAWGCPGPAYLNGPEHLPVQSDRVKPRQAQTATSRSTN